jgi:beta-glucuronidase
MRRFWFAMSLLALVTGLGSLALTLYLWFGAWPQRTKELVDHLRSVAESRGKPPAPLIGNIRGRAITSLAGTWKAVIDPYERADLGGMAPLAREPRHPSDLSEFSFEDGLTLRVPADWNSQDPRLVFYQGVVWYKRRFEHHPTSGQRAFLWFGAANYRSWVYLNGRLLGEHSGGFTPFNFEVTEVLRKGSNLLVVRVDSTVTDDQIPTPTTDWHNYGGLTRDVYLVALPTTFVRSYRIQLDPESPGRIRGWVQLDGPDRTQAVRVSIPELQVASECHPDAEGRAELDIVADPEPWSPERPRLYRVEIRSGEDVVVEAIGFRTVSVRGTEILLNGEPIFLRGISLHEEAPFRQGRASNRAHAEALLGWARDLEANFVRLAHYPHNEHMARLADELGLLVWAEIPVYWSVAFDHSTTLALAKQQLSELIERDQNRAAVILWSVANETPQGEDRLRFLTALTTHVRSLDPDRLVTAAMLSGRELLTPFMLRAYLPALLGLRRSEWLLSMNDPLGEVLDVLALNEYFGWYYSGFLGVMGPFSSAHTRRVMLENMDRIRIRTGLEKPLIVSELGAGAKAGWHAPEEELVVFSEEYQALVYRRQIEMLSRQPGLAGMSPWILKDFRSPLRLYQGVQDHWNLKGLISDDGRKKRAFSVLRDHYRALKERS